MQYDIGYGLIVCFLYYVDICPLSLYSPGLIRFCQSSFGICVMGYIYSFVADPSLYFWDGADLIRAYLMLLNFIYVLD